MAITQIESPRDALTTNQWVVEIEGVRYVSFSNITGLSYKTGTVSRFDGGTGQKITFPNNQREVGQLTLTRQVDPQDPNDGKITALFRASIEQHTKYSVTIIKYHKSQELKRYRLYGFLFFSESHPALDKGTGNIYAMTYLASCDFFEEVISAQ